MLSTSSRGLGRGATTSTKKAEEIVKEGKERSSLTLEGFEKEVELDGKKYVVKVRD